MRAPFVRCRKPHVGEGKEARRSLLFSFMFAGIDGRSSWTAVGDVRVAATREREREKGRRGEGRGGKAWGKRASDSADRERESVCVCVSLRHEVIRLVTACEGTEQPTQSDHSPITLTNALTPEPATPSVDGERQINSQSTTRERLSFREEL